jgi:hypothetical protein
LKSSTGFLVPRDGEFADVAVAAGTGLESRDRAMQVLVDVCKAPGQERIVDQSEMYSDSATVALGAKTPVLDMADLFAAVSGRKRSVTETG